MTNKTHPILASSPASTSVLNDQLVDMAFITTFCGVVISGSTDKFSSVTYPGRLSWVAARDGLKARLRNGCKNESVADDGIYNSRICFPPPDAITPEGSSMPDRNYNPLHVGYKYIKLMMGYNHYQYLLTGNDTL